MCGFFWFFDLLKQRFSSALSQISSLVKHDLSQGPAWSRVEERHLWLAPGPEPRPRLEIFPESRGGRRRGGQDRKYSLNQVSGHVPVGAIRPHDASAWAGSRQPLLQVDIAPTLARAVLCPVPCPAPSERVTRVPRAQHDTEEMGSINETEREAPETALDQNPPSGRQHHTKPVSDMKTDVLALLGLSQSHGAQGRLRTERQRERPSRNKSPDDFLPH